jgi:hypothetical protein
MSNFQEAADKLARDMMIHAIAYFEKGGGTAVLKAMQQRITGALLRINTARSRIDQPVTSTTEIKLALGIKGVPHD